MFILFAVLRYGAKAYKEKYIDKDSDFRAPNLYFIVAVGVNLVLGVFLIQWWMSQGYSEYTWFDAEGNWNVFDVYSNASIVTQWALVILSGILLNRWLYRRFVTRVGGGT